MLISQMTGLMVLIVPLMTQNERQLPLKMYVPYSMVELLPYLLTYLEQTAAVFYGVLLNVALDSLVYGLMIQTCGQIELLCYRLSETFRFLQRNNKEKKHADIEKFAIAECVRHHVSVWNITHRIQSLFMWIIATLFFFSLITLCSSIYQMSNKKLFSVEFFAFVLYLGSMLFQVFSYCWYGNELDLKNKSIAYAIYASDWTIISVKQRKNLSFMMMISQRGRMISFYGVCSLVLSTFTYAIVILIYEFTISEVIELVRTHDDIEDITEGLFLALTYVALCCKYGNFLVRRNEVTMLLDCFRSATCQPRNSEERMILIKYDRKAKWCVKAFMSISQATCIALILAPIVGPQKTDRPLPFKTYLPYSISGLYPYLLTYLNHVGAIFYGVLLNVSFDSLVYGFTLHVCGQIELLCYRLSKIFKDHPEQYLIDPGAMISECKKLLSVGFLSLTLYLGSMLFQVFFYCWYGNELQLKVSFNWRFYFTGSQMFVTAKWSTITFMMISFVSGLGFMLSPALGLLNGGERVLPVKSYIPYSVSNLLPYLATYLQQFLAMFYAIILNVSFDSLVYGFTIQACAQIELMCCRLANSLNSTGDVSSGRKREVSVSIVECVRHHLLVSILIKKVRALFMWTVMIFFFFSLLIVCTSIFLISKKKPLSLEFLSMLMYLSDMLLQLFYYCWYGNELELKSKSIATAIYTSDWTMVTPRERRSLMLIMINSQKGIMMSYHGVFALSLNTFTWICRTSYSAYNLLQSVA
ncbi:PREDICTED: uncharacterized protein LOC105457144 [Wasmannia auropunctata]|uniref:uncharacterized protein LOC105457144 n=1 Tax=Wasmannia auropunctata TaxID=64793 RepID=UPI0005EED623|nr:PREDICTED: uncharacterized protein LOC105457144 [Wasmannia auropunctata]